MLTANIGHGNNSVCILSSHVQLFYEHGFHVPKVWSTAGSGQVFLHFSIGKSPASGTVNTHHRIRTTKNVSRVSVLIHSSVLTANTTEVCSKSRYELSCAFSPGMRTAEP